MKKIIYALLSLMPLLFLMGCSEDDKVVEPGIQLGETEVTFSRAKDNKEVTVTIDTAHDFTATWKNEGSVWGEVTKGEGKVTIYVNENAQEDARVGSVLITTIGDVASKVITVHQNGTAAAILDVLPEFIKYNQHAASKTFIVTTDASKWFVSGETDWLTISIDRAEFNEVIVTVTENTGDKDRNAELIVTAGEHTKKVQVTQTRALDLILPYLIIDAAVSDVEIKANIREFEEERGSTFIVDAGMMSGHAYRIPSKNFPEIRYVVMGGIFMIIQHPNNYEVLKSPELRSLIEENGFKYYYTTDNGIWDHFWRESGGVELRIDHANGQMEFYPNQNEPVDPAQTQDYPTFASMPKPYLDWDATKTMIHDWEIADGSTLMPDLPVTPGWDQFVYSTSYNDPRKEFERSYWIKDPESTAEFIQTMYMYKDYSLVYYLPPPPHDNIMGYLFTREFKKLLSDGGYVKIKPDWEDPYYFNETDNLTIYTQIVDYPVDAPETTLWLTIRKGKGLY